MFVIGNLILMLPAIEFDCQFLLNVSEVGNVIPYRMLATKAMTIQLFITQRLL